MARKVTMTTKAKCYELAKEHNLEIKVDLRRWYHEVNLPEGYQLSDYDDRTGLCMTLHSFSTREQLWTSLMKDIEDIISYKPWLKTQD